MWLWPAVLLLWRRAQASRRKQRPCSFICLLWRPLYFVADSLFNIIVLKFSSSTLKFVVDMPITINFYLFLWLHFWWKLYRISYWVCCIEWYCDRFAWCGSLMWLYKHCWMMSTSLNHCKEMGAEPGRRSLKMPAEKLGPVIVAFDKERRIPATGASHLKKLTSIKKLWETRNDLRIVAWNIFSMEILLSLLYRNWSVIPF